MPRPRPAPFPSPDHQQHDALLVAQYAAGDPLDADGQRAASTLVSSCAACAALAADLRAISAAVAWEPVPPRRRDFRIDGPTAERLRGSGLSRLLRRLSLPQARVLRPAAIGVMSIGLLFVVAGTVWPAADLGLSGTPALIAPAGEALPADEMPLAPQPPADSLADTLEPPPADTVPGEANAAAELETSGESDGLADEAAALETQADDVAGKAATRAAPPAVGAEQDSEAVEGVAPEGEEPKAFALEASEDVLGQGAETESAGALEPAAALEAGAAEDMPAAAREAGAAEGEPAAADEAADLAAPAEGLAAGAVLLVVGAVLAVAGALLLLLAWLARRSADPLLR